MLNKQEIGALILRLTLGALFFIHGFAKFQGGIENIVGWFSSMGIPGFMAYVIAVIEILGGFALILGLGTRIISSVFVLLMIGAILKVKLAVGLLGNGKMAGYELDLAFIAIALYLGINGSTFYSIDRMLFNSTKETKAV
ncbi:DoxX family protein [Neobacillus terrae]|uniref:DoxX family protein n=1 Tax=Neobacillus terrae TaxID=3034837 RepID=UPI001A9CAB59|nr:DoxX family protein [Neobacillus terrae]